MRPTIALLTDFGTRDHYAGTMKGVILGICPDVSLVDITHEVTPHDVLEGALQLGAAFKYFPAGTVFLAVVDPGVGSSRRALAVQAGDWRFVAPDNGLLTIVLRQAPAPRVVELTEQRYARPVPSRTFEGRDRFAPAAAWLATGLELSELGRPVLTYQLLDIPMPQESGDLLQGSILQVDRFGNLITNISRERFDRFAEARHVELSVGGSPVGRIVATYADIQPGELGALFGSTDHLEVASRMGSAAGTLNLSRGAAVVIRRGTRRR